MLFRGDLVKKCSGTVFSVLGAVIGAGMITGVEVREYFGSSVLSPVLIALAVALMTFMLWLIMDFCIKHSAFSTDALCGELFAGSAPVMRASLMLGAVITCGVMLSGMAAMFNELFAIPVLLSAPALGAAGSFLAMHGVKWLKWVNFIAIPAIVVFIAAVLPLSGAGLGQEPAPAGAFFPYAAYNTALAIPLCCALSAGAGRCLKKALALFAVFCFIIITVIALIVSAAPQDAALPVLSVAAGISVWTGALYSLGLFGAAATTYIAGMFAFNHSKARLFAAAFAAVLLSLLPLKSIVKYIYPISGISCIIIVIRILMLGRKNK